MNRYRLFDRARGFAIVLMVMANGAPMLGDDVSFGFWFRIIASIAAPIFVLTAGIMVALSAQRHDFLYYLWRGLFVVGMGAVVDITANNILPFQSCDVLYLIGIMTTCTYLLSKLKTPHVVITILALFVVAFVVQTALPYQPLPLMTYFSGEVHPDGATPSVLQHWFVDGWFPLLPWLPFGCCGILFARFYQAHGSFICTRFLAVSTLLLGAGIVLNLIFVSPFYLRYGYIELFYPPTAGFILAALGAASLIFVVAEWSLHHVSFTWLENFGGMSLAIYIAHLLLIGHVFATLFYPITTMTTFFAIFALHLFVLTLLAHGIIFIRRTYPSMPVLLRWLVGK